MNQVAYFSGRLADMPAGRRAHVVPWAVRVRNDGTAVVDLLSPASSHPGGTQSLPITRTQDRWIAEPSSPRDHRWITDDRTPGVQESRYQPVYFDLRHWPGHAGKDAALLATMPDELRQDTVARLPVGDRGFAVPWAMRWDGQRLTLHPNYMIHAERGGTVQMEIAHQPGGYAVDARSLYGMSDFDWSRDVEDPYLGSAYVGSGKNRARGLSVFGDPSARYGAYLGEKAQRVIEVMSLALPQGTVRGDNVPTPPRIRGPRQIRLGLRRMSFAEPTLREAVRVLQTKEHDSARVPHTPRTDGGGLVM